jgi:hypothetical protein
MAIHEPQAELINDPEKRVFTGSLVQNVEVQASTRSARRQCNDSS